MAAAKDSRENSGHISSLKTSIEAGRQLLRLSGRRGLRARLIGLGVRNRMVRLKPGQGKRRDVRSRKR